MEGKKNQWHTQRVMPKRRERWQKGKNHGRRERMMAKGREQWMEREINGTHKD
jgi:hypothetical protein